MALHEFELIQRYFSGFEPQSTTSSSQLNLGVGDDCALYTLAPGQQLAITTDTLVEGVHFPVACDPGLLASRALRVNLSDLAAMGAEPLGCQLALTLPEANPAWLEKFSTALALELTQFQCPLSGGDTTRGPLTITLTMLGTVPSGKALTRGGARDGDRVYVSGTLGDARGGLQLIEQQRAQPEALLARYWQPTPRLGAGVALRGLASAALDISDGLLQDVGHIAHRSHLGVIIERDKLPLSTALLELVGGGQAYEWGLGAGDDYELCFTAAAHNEPRLNDLFAQLDLPLTCVGRMTAEHAGVVCIDGEGNVIQQKETGYAHF